MEDEQLPNALASGIIKSILPIKKGTTKKKITRFEKNTPVGIPTLLY